MQVMDIVNRAVMKSGVVSSYNPDEVPEDIQERAADVLRHEIIRELNCDDAVELSETVMLFEPVNGIIDLVTPPLDYNYYIIADVVENVKQVTKVEMEEVAPGITVTVLKGVMDLLERLGYIRLTGSYNRYGNVDKTDLWPKDQFGNYRNVAVWTSDYKLVEIQADESTYWYNVTQEYADSMVNKRYNVPFAPVRVVDLLRASDGVVYKYLHAGEFVSAEFRHVPTVYMVEDTLNRLRIRLQPTHGNQPVLIVLPFPIKIINSFDEPHPYQGTVVASDRFFPFLLNVLAWRMAAEYGITSEEKMKTFAMTSYTAILKSRVKHEHPQDISRKIFNYLERGRGYFGNGYSGGPYGR